MMMQSVIQITVGWIKGQCSESTRLPGWFLGRLHGGLSRTFRNSPYGKVAIISLVISLFLPVLGFAAAVIPTPPPAPNPSAVSASAQVTLSPSTAQMNQVENLFDQADYKHLDNTPNDQEHLNSDHTESQ